MNQRHNHAFLVIVTLIALLLIGTHFTGGSAAAAGGISINDVSLTEGITSWDYEANRNLHNLARCRRSNQHPYYRQLHLPPTTQQSRQAATISPKSGTATIPANCRSPQSVTVLVNSDKLNEANETLFVDSEQCIRPIARTILDAHAIRNDQLTTMRGTRRSVSAMRLSRKMLAGAGGLLFSVVADGRQRPADQRDIRHIQRHCHRRARL